MNTENLFELNQLLISLKFDTLRAYPVPINTYNNEHTQYTFLFNSEMNQKTQTLRLPAFEDKRSESITAVSCSPSIKYAEEAREEIDLSTSKSNENSRKRVHPNQQSQKSELKTNCTMLTRLAFEKVKVQGTGEASVFST